MIRLELTEIGKRSDISLNPGLRTESHINLAISEMQDVDYADALDVILFEIRKNIVDDRINEANAKALGRPLPIEHIISGDLFNSITSKVFLDNDVADIELGYFVPYGKNLEEGDVNSEAYPIIMPVFEANKEDFKEQVFEKVAEKFKESFSRE